MGIDDLLETVILTAEMQELKANPNRAGKGSVIEARLDKTRGPIATLLVQNGTLHQGDIIIAGTAVGRVRVMTNDKGQQVKDAGPSIPVEITGLTEVPTPGDEFSAVADERMARQLVEQRKQKIKDDLNKLNQKVTLESLFSKLKEGEMKELNLIVKADVQGSAEAVKASASRSSPTKRSASRSSMQASARSTSPTSCWPPPPTPSSSASTSVPNAAGPGQPPSATRSICGCTASFTTPSTRSATP